MKINLKSPLANAFTTVLCLLTFTFQSKAQFDFTLNGTATQVNTIEYQLTVDNCHTHGFTVGSMWQDNQLDLNNSFDITYRLMFGGNSGSTVSGYCANGNGADGIIFALQRNGTNVSTVSDNSLGLKIGGMTEAFGVEFDTFENGAANDPWYDHMAIFQDGDVVHGNEIGNQGYVQIEDGGNNVEDNAWHLVRMVWDADAQEFEAYVDCSLRLTYSGDMVNDIFGGNTDVYYGFIGVNGFHVNRHAVQLNLLSLSLLNDTICAGESVQLESGFSTSSSFAWHATNGDNSTISNATISNPVVTPTRTTTYVVSYNDGCNLRSDTSTIVVHDAPSLTVNDAAVCQGQTYNLDAGDTGGYLWSTGATTQSITISTAGNYALTFTDANSCETTADMDLTVNSNPSVTLNNAAICTGASHTLNAGAGFTYNWAHGASTQTVQVSSAGNYEVTITDGYGCSGSDDMTLSLYTNPTVSLNDAAICAGSTHTLNAGGGYSYEWSTGASSQTIGATPAGNYAVTITDSNGCTGSDDMDLTVNSNPTVSLSNAAICAGDTETLDAGGGFSYNWSTGASTQTIDITAAGNYAVTITDGNGCEGDDDMNLTVNSNPSVTLSDAAICAGSSQTLDAGAGFNYLWSTTAVTQTIDVSTAGNFAVTITDGNGCRDMDDMDLTVNTNPTVTLNDNDICSGSSLALNAGAGYTYNWTTGANSQTINVSAAGNYGVTITDGNLCTGQDEMTLTVNTNPTVTLNDTEVCSGASTTLDAGAGYSYLWSDASNNQTLVVSSANTYSVTITDGNGCSDSDNMTLTVNANPTVTLNDAEICSGSSFTLDAGAGFAYDWSTAATTQTIDISSAGNYEVTITDGNGCRDSDDMNLTVNSNPTVILNDAAICAGTTHTLDAGTGYNYLWSTGATTQTINPGLAANYSITITDGNGCQGQDNMTLTVNANPSVSLADGAICSGDNLTLDPGAGYTYTWTTGSNNQTIVVSTAGNYGVTITDGNGCMASDDMNLTINANLSINIDDEAICAGDSYLINPGTSGSYNYSWSNGASTSTLTVTSAGLYGVTVTDGNSCSGQDDMNLTVNSNPTVTLNDQDICQGASASLSAGSGYTYAWTTGNTTQSINVSTAGNYGVTITDGNDCTGQDDMNLTVNSNPSVTLNDAAICSGSSLTLDAGPGYAYNWSTGANTRTIVVYAAGNYAVTITDGNLCRDVGDMDLTVNSNPTVTLNDAAICSGSNLTLDAGPGYAYAWSNGSTSQTTIVSSAGNYEVTITDGNGCSGSYDMDLTINTLPTVTLNDAAICAGSSTSLNAGTGFTYNWTTGNNDQIITISSAGSYGVTITDGNGCQASDDMTLTVNSNPIVTLNNVAICYGNSHTLDAGAGFSYNWSTGAATQSIVVNAANTYGVTITDGNGCTDQDDMLVTVNANPTATLNDAAICAGSSLTLNAGTGYGYSWSNGASQQLISINSAGNYAVTITDGNGCQDSDDMDLTVNTNPTVTLSNAAVCAGNLTTLDAGAGYTYDWSNGANSQTINIGTAGSYSVTITDGNGCVGHDDMNLTVYNNPTVTLDDAAICAGSTQTLDAGAGYSYAWSTGAVGQTIAISSAGNYRVTITDGNGCQATDDMDLVVNSNPSVTLADQAVCAGQTATIDAGPGYTYLWSNATVNQTVVTGSAGTYGVTITDGSGCQGSDDMNLTVYANPVVTLNNDEVCDGFSTTVNAGAGFDYFWSTGATTQIISISAGGNYDVTITDGNGCRDTDGMTLTINGNPVVVLNDDAICSGSKHTLDAGPSYLYQWSTGVNTQTIEVSASNTYSVTITDGNGCQGNDDMFLTVFNNPTVTLNDGALCDGDDLTLDAGAGFTYAWSTGSNNQTIVINTAGNYAVTITDGNGCQASDDMNLTVNNNLVLNIPNAAICDGETYTISSGTGGGYQYFWNTGASTESISVATSGNYAVTVTDGNACNGSDDMTLTVNSNPTVVLDDQAVCAGTTGMLDAGAGYTYLWNTGSVDQVIYFNTAGTYGVTITDGNSCQASDDMTFTVYSNPVVELTDSTICSGAMVTLDAGPGFNYNWSTSNNGQTITVNTTGNYAVTITDGNNCVGQDDMDLVVNPTPTVVLNDAAICADDYQTFDAGSGLSYLWNNGMTLQSLVTNAQGTYAVTVTNGFNCSATDQANLTVNDLPIFDISDFGVCTGQLGNALAPSGHTSYLWSNGSINQNATLFATGQYGVTVTDVNGCVAQDEFNFTINPLPVVNIENDTVCIGDLGRFTAPSFSSYQWSTGASTQQINVGNVGGYQLTVTDANGCQQTDDMSLVNYERLAVNPIQDCNSTNTAFTLDFNIVGGDPSSYTVNGSPIGSTWTSPLIPNGFPYQFIFKDDLACDSVVIEGTGNLSCACTSFAGSMTSQSLMEFCGPDTAIAGYQHDYVFDGDDSLLFILHDQPSTLGNVLALNDVPEFAFDSSYMTFETTYYISAVVASKLGGGQIDLYEDVCTDVAPGTPIIFHALPTVHMDDLYLCNGQSGVLDAGVQDNYYWSNGRTTANITVSHSGNYSLTVTNVHGCQSAASASVHLLPLPVVTLSDRSICEGESANLDATGAELTYLWSTGNINGSITASTPGTYSVTVTNLAGCSGVGSMVLSSNPLPEVKLDDLTICRGDAYLVDPGRFNSYLWSDGRGHAIRDDLKAGTYTLSVTDNNGCKASDHMVFIVNENPVPQLQSLEQCARSGANLSLVDNYVAYQWNTGEVTPAISAENDGLYIVTVTDGNGCLGVASGIVDVIETPELVASISDPLICEGQAASMVFNIQDPGNNGPYSAQLDINGVTITQDLLNLGDNQIIIHTDASTTVEVALLSTGTGCDFEADELDVEIPNIDVADNAAVGATATGVDCFNGSAAAQVDFELLTGSTPWSLTYRANGNLHHRRGIDQAVYTIENAFEGLYEVIAVIDGNGCFLDSGLLPVEVDVLAGQDMDLEASVSWDPSCSGTIYELIAGGNGVEAVTWLVNDETVTDNPAYVEVDYNKEVEIYLIGRSANCSDTLYFQDTTGTFDGSLRLNEQNILTPDGDGLNDYFELDPESLYSTCSQLHVFNRWGTLIYEAQPGESGWDGMGLNGPAPEGTYFVIFDIEGQETINRSVTLFR